MTPPGWLPASEVRRLARSVGWQVGVPEGLLFACAICESGDRHNPEKGANPGASRTEAHLPLVSGQPDGSLGLLQVLRSTARDLGVEDLSSLLVPEFGMRIGAKYLRAVTRMLSPEMISMSISELRAPSNGTRERWLLGVAGYNAGPGRVARAVGRAGEGAPLSAVLDLLDKDPKTTSKNEATTKEHVAHVRAIWSAEDARRDHEA